MIFIILNSLIGALKLTKDPNPDMYSYSHHGIGFDQLSSFHCWVMVGLVKV